MEQHEDSRQSIREGDGGEPAAPVRKGWPLSSLLLFAVSAVLAVLAVLLWTGTVRLPAKAPPVTPGAIRTVDVVSALKAAGVPAEIDGKLFVPRGELGAPGQGMKAGGAPMLLFVFPDGQSARAAFEKADKANILPPTLPGGIDVDPEAVTVAQGSNVVVALVGGDERTRETVKTVIEELP